MTGRDEDYDVTASDQETAGDMGVSSEREGATGPGQHGTTGVRDVSEPDAADVDAEDTPREQSAGGPETNPDPGTAPKSGYSSQDPRSDD